MSAPTSKTKQKKVRYEVGTKGSPSHHHHHHHHRHRSSSSPSRDSGVGSSSASDRASLGTTPNSTSTSTSTSSPFSTEQIETQRHSIRAVREALDAANEQIRHYEASTAKLNALLAESNKENRLLRREKAELCSGVEDLEEERRKRNEMERMRRGSSSRHSPPRTSQGRNSRDVDHGMAASSSSSSSSATSAPRLRSSYQQKQPPPNASPNPFLPSPRNSSAGVPSSAVPFAATPPQERAALAQYPPSAVSYATIPSTLYVSAPLQVRSRSETGGSGSVNDGKYHLSPL